MRRIHYLTVLIVALVLASADLAHAQLTWEQTRITVVPKPDQKQVTATFRFTNTGNQHITIRTVKAPSGCEVTRPDKRTWKPGQSGEIRVSYALGARQADVTMPIAVMTDDPARQWTQLLLSVEWPKRLALSDRHVSWRVGEPAEPKTITIEVNGESSAQVLGATCRGRIHAERPDDAAEDSPTEPEAVPFTVEVRTITEGRRYALQVTPTQTAQPATGRILLKTDVKDEHPATYRIFVVVHPLRSEDPPKPSEATELEAPPAP